MGENSRESFWLDEADEVPPCGDDITFEEENENVRVFMSKWERHYLRRSDYSNKRDGLLLYWYAETFMEMALAESQNLQLPTCEDELNEEQILELRVNHGITWTGVSFTLGDNNLVLAKPSTHLKGLKKENSVTITRTTLESCLKIILTVKEVARDYLSFEYVGTLPEELTKVVWRLDLVEVDYVLPRILDSILEFTQKENDDLVRLICNEELLLEDREDMDRFTMRSGCTYEDIEVHVQKHLPMLNTSQREAVMATFQHRIVLIQGPPGTGKTSTSAAIVSMHRASGQKDDCGLVCTSSNVAADNLAVVLKRREEKFVRFGEKLSPDFQDDLLDHSPEAKIMAEVAPEGRNRNKKLSKGVKARIREEIDAAYAKTPLTAVGTLGSVSSNKYKRVYSFALLDEAAQSPEHETICALVRLALNAGVCFAGDYKQLPPFSRNHKVKEMVYLSMMERLSHIPGVKHVLLRIQYRMVEVIARWPSEFFYDSELQTDLALCRARAPPRGIYWPAWNAPMAFVHHETSHQKMGTSVQNEHEVMLIEGALKNLLNYGGHLASDIAVLTPYSNQRNLLRQRLYRFIWEGLCVETIDKAQGTERPLIVLSLVRSSTTSRSIGFVSDPRRLNVAITRAKLGLIVVGNAATLIQGEHYGCWLSYLRHLDSLGCIVDSNFYRKHLSDILKNYDIDEAKLVKADKAKLKMEFTYLRHGRILSEADRKILIRELVNFAVKLLHFKEYLFWLDWILRLPEHCYGANNQPDDPVKKDQKSWSHITELFRFGMGRDAANLTYFYCMAMLAHMLQNVPNTWTRFTACRLELPIADGYC